MNGYITFGAGAFLLVLVAVALRTRGARRGSTSVQLLGGFNVFAAALLAWMTCITLFMAFNNGLGLSTAFLKWSSIIFAVGCMSLWGVRGLVPNEVAEGKRGKAVLGHLLLLSGTILHGSVTFYMPILIWLGFVKPEASAVLPWLALFTFPAACVLWGVGAAFIADTRSNKRLQATRETRASEA